MDKYDERRSSRGRGRTGEAGGDIGTVTIPRRCTQTGEGVDSATAATLLSQGTLKKNRCSPQGGFNRLLRILAGPVSELLQVVEPLPRWRMGPQMIVDG